MRNVLQSIATDYLGLCRVCGPVVGTRWLLGVATRFGACRKAGNLQPADQTLGDGPIAVNYHGARAELVGPRILSGIREIWVRDVYLGGGFVRIKPGDHIVDLGCNRGNFTALALAHGDDVTATVVEVNEDELGRFRNNIGHNGWLGRVNIVQAFLGNRTHLQDRLDGIGALEGVPTITEDELIDGQGIEKIDFLKCDIEGSEFGLFDENSRLLKMARQIAMEIHTDVGSADEMIALLEGHGFEIKVWHEIGHTVLMQGRKR